MSSGDAGVEDGSAGGASTGGKGTGGTGTGGKATGGSGTGGVSVEGGALDAGDSCATLAACCGQLMGVFARACNDTVSSKNARSCTAAHDLFCGGGILDGGGLTDAGGGCAALAGCCASSNRKVQCERIVANDNDATCNQVAPILCN